MQRYFTPVEQIDGKAAQILGDDVHHLLRVMRAQVGDEIILSDGRGKAYRASIHEISSNQVNCTIEEELQHQSEMPVQITLAQSMPKGEKWDWILQKCTELGVHAFLPFISERTIVKLDNQKEGKRRERWERIIKEAAEQSHRNYLPRLHPLHQWKELLQAVSQYDLVLMAYEGEEEYQFAQALRSKAELHSILIIIGPEGGFASHEVQEAINHGASIVTLGPRILRTETAGLYTLSCCSYHFEQNGGSER